MTDWGAVAAKKGRDAFVSSHRNLFLVSEGQQVPVTPMRTMEFRALSADSDDFEDEATAAHVPRLSPAPSPRAIQEICKRQNLFGEMITVGRTQNHDIVLLHATISKFHAFFRTEDGVLHLFDAGSRNGTFVNGRRLPPKVATAVASGDNVAFGSVDSVIRDSASLYDLLRS